MNQRLHRHCVILIMMFFITIMFGCNKSILDEEFGNYVYPNSDYSKEYTFTKETNIDSEMKKLKNVNTPLTLQDCYKIALKNNEGVIMAGKGIEIAKTNLWVANLAWIPRLSIQGEVSYRTPKNLVKTGNPFYDPNDPNSGSPTIETESGTQDDTSGLAEIMFPIYLFGRVVNNVDMRTAALDISFADERRTKQQIIYLVNQLYTNILELEKTVEVLESSIKLIEELQKNAQNFFDEGLVTKNEVLVLEVTLSSRKQGLLEAKSALKQIRYQFNSILNLDIQRNTKLANLNELPEFKLSEDPLVNLALHYRPEIVKAMSEHEQSAAQLRLAQCNRWPMLYGFVDLTASSQEALVNNAWLSFGARMQWQILDSGETSANIRNAKTAMEIQKLQTRMLYKDIMIDVRGSYEDLKVAENKLKVSEKGVEQAEENLRILQNKFNAAGGSGALATSAEVLEGETLLLDAKREYWTAIFGIHRAWAKLEFATGLKFDVSYASKKHRFSSDLEEDPSKTLESIKFDKTKNREIEDAKNELSEEIN